jgi:hypothetical protein
MGGCIHRDDVKEAELLKQEIILERTCLKPFNKKIVKMLNFTPKLQNVGNTCFGNAIIQVLYSTTVFRESFLKYAENNKMDLSKSGQLFAQLLSSMTHEDPQDNRQKILLELYQKLSEESKAFQVGDPDDSLAFFSVLLNILGKSGGAKQPEELDYVKIFDGTIKRTWTCTTCNKIILESPEPLPPLHIHPANFTAAGAKNLFDFDKDEDECENCQTRTIQNLTSRLTKIPQILILRPNTTQDAAPKCILEELTLPTSNGTPICYDFYAATLNSNWGRRGHAIALVKSGVSKNSTSYKESNYMILNDAAKAVPADISALPYYPALVFYKLRETPKLDSINIE